MEQLHTEFVNTFYNMSTLPHESRELYLIYNMEMVQNSHPPLSCKHEEMEVYLHSFFMSAQVGGKWFVTHSALHLRKDPWYLPDRR